MTCNASARRAAVIAALGESARRARARYNLTPEERRNLRAAQTPLAVITASLGGHPHRR